MAETIILGIAWSFLPAASILMYAAFMAIFRERHLHWLPVRVYAILGTFKGGLTGLMFRPTSEPLFLVWRLVHRLLPRFHARIAQFLVLSPPRGSAASERFVHQNRLKIICVSGIAGLYGSLSMGMPIFIFSRLVKHFNPADIMFTGLAISSLIIGAFFGVMLFFTCVHGLRDSLALIQWFNIARRHGGISGERMVWTASNIVSNFWLGLYVFFSLFVILLIGGEGYFEYLTSRSSALSELSNRDFAIAAFVTFSILSVVNALWARRWVRRRLLAVRTVVAIGDYFGRASGVKRKDRYGFLAPLPDPIASVRDHLANLAAQLDRYGRQLAGGLAAEGVSHPVAAVVGATSREIRTYSQSRWSLEGRRLEYLYDLLDRVALYVGGAVDSVPSRELMASLKAFDARGLPVGELRSPTPKKMGRWRSTVIPALEDLEKPMKAMKGIAFLVFLVAGLVVYVSRNDPNIFLRIFTKAP